MASRWYVIHVYSGFEKKVATAIREQAEDLKCPGADLDHGLTAIWMQSAQRANLLIEQEVVEPTE